MSKQREALQMALEALESDNPDIMLLASIAIRDALAEPEQQLECLTITPEEIEEICKTAGFASYAVIKMMNKFNIKLNDTNTSIFQYAHMIKGALNDEQRT